MIHHVHATQRLCTTAEAAVRSFHRSLILFFDQDTVKKLAIFKSDADVIWYFFHNHHQRSNVRPLLGDQDIRLRIMANRIAQRLDEPEADFRPDHEAIDQVLSVAATNDKFFQVLLRICVSQPYFLTPNNQLSLWLS